MCTDLGRPGDTFAVAGDEQSSYMNNKEVKLSIDDYIKQL